MVAATCIALLLATLLLWAPHLPLTGPAALTLLCVLVLLAAWRSGLRWCLLVALAGLPVVAMVTTGVRLLGERWPDTDSKPDTVLSGAICEFPRLQAGAWRFVVTTDPDSRARGLPERVLVSWYADSSRPVSPPEPGERWTLNLRLRPPRGLSNPGTFDYERWLFSQRIGATGWVRPSATNTRMVGLPSACPSAGWRAATARRIRSALDGRESLPYVLGLAIGAYQALPEAEWDKLRRTGTVHLISISGFHIALVAMPAALLGLGLARLLLAARVRCRPRVVAAWTAVAAAAGYGALAGFSVPTARSLVAVVLAAALLTARRSIAVCELLACVALGVLLVEPLAPLVPGFWLSFGGVIVLVVVAARFPSRPGIVQLWLVTQLAMTVGLAPLLALFFGQVPVSGFLANLVSVPAFSLVLLPLTLLGGAATWLSPGGGTALLGLAADGFDVWRWYLDWCANLPGAVLYLPEPSRSATLLAGAGVVWMLWPAPWPARWLGPVMLAGLLAAGIPRVPPGGLRVTVMDVGQGLSVLVQTAGHALVYDAGPAFRDSDAGERVVVPVLQALGVRQLDVLLVSHGDADHRGGAASILERYPRTRVLGPVGGPGAGLVAPCEAGNSWRWDGVLFQVLHPAAGDVHRDDNAASCVLRVSGAQATLLLPGDIERPEEHTLSSRPDFGPVDLVLAPHHGSRTSSSELFVERTRPPFVVAAAGHRNRWGFPAPEVVNRWRTAGACVLATADAGALQFESSARSGFRLVGAERVLAPGIWLARPAASPPCR